MREERQSFTKTASLTVTGLLMALAALAAQAQQGGPPDTIRALPAAVSPPEDAAAAERLEKERVPEPPARGQSKGRALPAASAPPPDVVAAEKAAQEKIPAPPGPARAEELVDKVRSRPGGAERAEAAKQGKAPAKAQGRSGGDTTSSALEDLRRVLIPDAAAGETLTVVLTPQVSGSNGQHTGLYTSSPYGTAYIYGTYVSSSLPSNSYVRLLSYQFTPFAHQITNPFVNSNVQIPADGWYIININALAYGGQPVNIHHYEGGSRPLIESIPAQSGWADYPTLQYLTAGYHYFYFVLPGGGYVSRISYDSYP